MCGGSGIGKVFWGDNLAGAIKILNAYTPVNQQFHFSAREILTCVHREACRSTVNNLNVYQ